MGLISIIKNAIGVAPSPLSITGGDGGRVHVGGASRSDVPLREKDRLELRGSYFVKPPPARQPRIHPQALAALIAKHGIELLKRDELVEKQKRWSELIEASKKFSYDAIRAEARLIRQRMREGDLSAADESPVTFDDHQQHEAGVRRHALKQAAKAVSAECPGILQATASAIESAARAEHDELEASERQTAAAYGVEFSPSESLVQLELLTWSVSRICAQPGVGSSPRQQAKQLGFTL